MSISILGGHVNTIQNLAPVDGRRRRRLHSAEFKANAVASCRQQGMSVAAVAMACGVNANLLHRWLREAEMRAGAGTGVAAPLATPNSRVLATTPAAFVPMTLPAKSALPDIRIELRRGATSVNVIWPAGAAAECAAWLRELLR